MRAGQTLGYSLVELLVVIAIVVILGAVFIPGLDSLRSRPTLLSAVSKLEDLIITARTTANSTDGVSSMVHLQQNGLVELYQVNAAISGCPGGAAWGAPELSLSIDGVIIGGSELTPNLCFSSDGQVLQSGGSFPVRYEVSRGVNEPSYRLTVWLRTGSVQREHRINQGAQWTLLP